MLFQTYDFLGFFIIVLTLFFSIKKNRYKQFLLLAVSLIFYSYGSKYQIFLFLFVILWTYILGILIEKRRSRFILFLGLLIAFAPLFFYKYFSFLLMQVFVSVPDSLQFVAKLSLPIGISFFTFQSVGYVIDVYTKKIQAEKDLIVYALFVSYFPQLVAGPIERSSHLLGQLKTFKIFNYNQVIVGLRYMATGFFLKVFVADNLSKVVVNVYGSIDTQSGIMLLVGTFLFGIQIYCDFNGYSLIAMGIARTMNIELMRNFDRPYFSKSVTEFWRRWHKSLSFWFRDYVFIPLGGNRGGLFRVNINLLITFILSGIWHGANWTFAIWGALNGLYLILEKILKLGSKKKKGIAAAVGWIYTYILINFTWIYFRADNLADAHKIIFKIVTLVPQELKGLVSRQIGLLDILPTSGLFIWNVGMAIGATFLVFVFDCYEEKRGEFVETLSNYNLIIRWGIYVLLIFIPLAFGAWGKKSQFIYFRF